MEEMQRALAKVLYEAWKNTGSGATVEVTGFLLTPNDGLVACLTFPNGVKDFTAEVHIPTA